jgi:S1-C subfamily serine protease
MGAAAAQPANPPAALPTPQSVAPAANATADVIGKSVVKVLSTVRYPDRFQPWIKKAPVSSSASGVVIKGRRILTTAHAVAYGSEVQVQGNQATDKRTATVEKISLEMDLAVLKLNDDSFFDTYPPLPRASKLPQVKNLVTAYGFPAEENGISAARGKVASIDFTAYNLGAAGLRVEVDGVINPGCTGGPVLAGDTMIGLAFSPPTKLADIFYIIPCEEIELFLQSSREGGYHGRPRLDLVLQGLQNPTLRSFLGVDKSVHGVVVQQVGPVSSDNPLRKWDIITQVGKTDIDDGGGVHLDNGLHAAFTYLLSQTAVNGKAPLTVIRSGQTLRLDVPLQSNPSRLLPGLAGDYPDYFVYGPLAFSDASQDLFYDLISGAIAGNSGINATMRLLDQDTPLVTRCADFPKFDGERLVIVTSFFQHKLTEGYLNPISQVVKTVNGAPIKNLPHLVQVLRDCKDKFVSIDFFGRYSTTLVFPREEVLAATEAILADNNVRSQGSPAMMAIWNEKK